MNCLYYYNNQSGKNKLAKKRDYIVSRLKTKYDGVDCFDSSSVQEMQKSLKAKKYDAIFFAGGDGTVNNMLNWTKDLKNIPTFGYIPSGTVNDFAKNLGFNKKLKKTLNVLLEGQEKKIDCFDNNGRIGIYVCGTGLFTSASYGAAHEFKKRFGKLAYYFYSIKEVFKFKAYNIEVIKDEEKKKLNSVLTLLINSKSVAGYNFNKGVNLNDGEMEFISVNQKKQKLTFRSLMLIIKMFLFGIKSVLKNKNVTYFKFKDLKVNFKNKKIVNIDGENGGEENINLKVLSDRVKFFCK